MNKNLFPQLYRTMLYLYPRQFQAEFAAEMQSVFAEAISQAATEGLFRLLKVFLTELFNLPGQALRQHYAEIQNQGAKSYTHRAIWEGPPSHKEMLVALAVFMLPGVFIWLNPAMDVSIGVLAAFASVMFLAGMLRGFPRWSLPSLGLALSAASFLFVFQWVTDLVTPSMLAMLGTVPRDESTRLILQAFSAGLMWFSLFALTFLVLGILALLRRFSSLFWRIRQDWTIASYILYSGVIFTLVLTFDQYRYERPYAIASVLCLATGAWLYLRSPQQWQRTLSLLAGLTLAMWAAAFGQWPIISIQDWMVWPVWHAPESIRGLEARWTILEWVWMVIFILAPVWLRLLPKPGRQT